MFGLRTLIREAWVLGQLGRADDLAQPLEPLTMECRDKEPPVAGSEAHHRRSAADRRALAFAHQLPGDAWRHEQHGRVEHGGVDALPDRRMLPLQERREDRRKGDIAAECIEYAEPEVRAVHVVGDVASRHAGHRLHRPLDGGIVAQRTALAVAGDRAIDQARGDGAQRFPITAEGFGHTWTIVLHEPVSSCHQAVEYCEAVWRLQIQQYGAFARVQGDKDRGPLTEVVASTWRFHLDHVGSEQLELLRAERTCQGVRQVQDANALERLRHRRARGTIRVSMNSLTRFDIRSSSHVLASTASTGRSSTGMSFSSRARLMMR